MTQTETQLSIKVTGKDKMTSLLFYSVFFLFSSTKIGHGRPSVKNRYAISDKNILRSYVVRYFYLKFLVCRSSMPSGMYKKKEKMCPVQCGRIKACISLRPNIRRSDCAWLLCLTSIACGETC